MKKLSKKILILASLVLCSAIALLSTAPNTSAITGCSSSPIEGQQSCRDYNGHDCFQYRNYQACKYTTTSRQGVSYVCEITFIDSSDTTQNQEAHDRVKRYCPGPPTQIIDSTLPTTDPESESETTNPNATIVDCPDSVTGFSSSAECSYDDTTNVICLTIGDITRCRRRDQTSCTSSLSLPENLSTGSRRAFSSFCTMSVDTWNSYYDGQTGHTPDPGPSPEGPGSDSNGGSFVGRTGADCRKFLGLITWDCNVNISDEDSLKSGIWIIVSNVLVDLTIIATYLILGYVIYGGYLYVLSSGDPSKVASGKKTLTNGFIGLAIVLLANIILNAIRVALGANFASNCTTGTAEGCYNMETAGDMVTGTISWVVGIAGVVAIIFLVYGGVQYMTASGDPGKAKKAKDTIMYALIGLAIVALAQIITALVSSAIRNASQDTSFTNNTTIAKEVHEKN